MLNNHFANSPTVGSHDNNATDEDFRARLQHLEDQFRRTENRRPEEEQPKKFKWGKIRKFFSDIIKPILIFIPALISSLAAYKKFARA